MKTKHAFSLLVSLVAGMTILSQLGFVKANAQGNIPLTSPLTYFISGTVVYKNFRWFTPAPGVTVEAKPTNSNSRYTIRTNDRGQYSLPVPGGTYYVKAYDRLYSIFTPFSRRVEVHQNVTDVNFMGIRK